MAFFGVTLEKIEKIWSHPNADKLQLAKCKDLAFQFVIGKGLYTEGQSVLYFPIDSNLSTDTKIKLGLEKMPSTRIRTVKLRNEISQGFVFPLDKANEIWGCNFETMTSEQTTEKLQVEKYDPPIQVTSVGTLIELPEGQSAYDIEGCERNIPILELISKVPVFITEKLEGTNISISKKNGQTYVCQRNNAIIPIEGKDNIYWKIAKCSGLFDFVSAYPEDIVIYGELVGPKIQSNIYKFPEHKIGVFDIKLKDKFISFEEFKTFELPENMHVLKAPILFEGSLSDFLQGKSIQEAANGNSVFLDTKREGIVIKPQIEQHVLGFGRLILKQHSPEYLAQ